MSKRCKALYAYSKQHTNEISFEAGDIIEDVVEHEDGWWSGMVHGQLGVFPYTYVELLPAEEYQNNNHDQGGGGYDNNDYNNDYNNYDQGGGGEGGGYDNNQGYEEELPEPPAEPHEINVRAVYDYVGKSSNELSIKKGDVFIVNEKDSEGKWWHGVFTEPSLRKGWFPAQYVEEIEPGTEHQQPPPQHQQPQQPSQPMVHHPQHPRIQGTKPLPPVQPRPQQPQQPQHHQAGYDNPHTPPVQPQPPHQIQLQPPQPEIKKDVPMKALKSEKAAKGVVGYVEVQVHGAQGLPGDTKTALVQIGVKEGDKGKLRKAFKTEVLKKDINPVWMEQFQVNIFDPEDSDLSIEVQDGKKSLGEITVPLRSTKRGPLETYGGLDKTYNLPVGTLHCIVSYRDVNAPSKPKNFKKDESITMSVTAAGFDLSKAGATWQQKFAEAGLEIASEETPSYTPPPPMGPKPVIPQLQQQQPQQPPKPAPQQPFQPQQPQPPQQQPQRPPKPAPQPPHLQQGFKPAPPQQPRPPVQPRPQQPQQPPQQPQPPQRRPPPPAGPRPGGGGGVQQHPPQFSLATQHNPGPTVSPRLVSPPKFESAPRTTQTPLPVQGVGRGPAVNRGPPPLPARDDGYY